MAWMSKIMLECMDVRQNAADYESHLELAASSIRIMLYLVPLRLSCLLSPIDFELPRTMHLPLIDSGIRLSSGSNAAIEL